MQYAVQAQWSNRVVCRHSQLGLAWTVYHWVEFGLDQKILATVTVNRLLLLGALRV